MTKHNHAQTHDVESLAEDARALMAATADVAGEKVGDARKRLGVALENVQKFAVTLRNKTVAGAKATDAAVHKHPYKAIAITVGVGAIIGFVLAGRKTAKK
jgi:ElaB/YqjD/DUF883 family membrane-anchored ribosome-binding protein